MTDMYEQAEADFDPISALTLITSARERYNNAQDAMLAAGTEQAQAVEQLNLAQERFDKLVQYLHETAPTGTLWWRQYINPRPKPKG